MAEAKKRSLQDANLVTEFGGVEDLPSFNAEGISQFDYSYVPGFSEMRVKRDIDIGRYQRHEIKAREVSTLPVNLRWFRAVRGAGTDPDHRRTVHAKRQGYRPVTKEDLKLNHAWLTDLPPGAMVAPDGVIKTAGGDLALYVIDQAGAARNAYRKKKLAEDMVDGLEMAAGGLGAVGQSHKGADPQVDKRIGEAV